MNVLQTILGGLALIALVAAGIFATGLFGLYRDHAATAASPPSDPTDSETIIHEGEEQ